MWDFLPSLSSRLSWTCKLPWVEQPNVQFHTPFNLFSDSLPGFSTANLRSDEQRAGVGRWRGQMAGLPPMLVVYKCANEQVGENRSFNGPKGG